MSPSDSGTALDAVPDPSHATHAYDDADRLVAWVREAANELEKAHNILDEAGIPRVRAESGNAMTLAARIYTLVENYGRLA